MEKKKFLIVLMLVIVVIVFIHCFRLSTTITKSYAGETDYNTVIYFADSTIRWKNYIDSYPKKLDLKPTDSIPHVFRIFTRNDNLSRNIICEVSLLENDSTIVITYRQRTKKYSDTNSDYKRIKIGNMKFIVGSGSLNGTIRHDTIYDLQLTSEIRSKLLQYNIEDMLSIEHPKGLLGGSTNFVDVNTNKVNRFHFYNKKYNEERSNWLSHIKRKLLKYYENNSDEIEVFE
jgi:hypothetical protein